MVKKRRSEEITQRTLRMERRGYREDRGMEEAIDECEAGDGV